MGAVDLPSTIVLFSARYLPSVGGVEFFTKNLAQTLAAKGFDVIVTTTEPADDVSGDGRQDVGSGSIEVLRLDSWGPTRMPFVRWTAHTRACLSQLRQLDDFSALVNTRFYDLSRVAARLCRKRGVRPVLIDHGTGYISFPSKALSLVAKVAEHVITANLRRYPIDFYGVSRDASQWLANFGIHSCGEIHNALDAEGFAAAKSARDFRAECGVGEETLCVVYAARLLADKGADVMVDAARLLEGKVDAHLFVAGTGALEQQVLAAAAELDNLTYVGMLSHPDLAALLSQGDVFCLPTRYAEGLPTSLLEGAACGCALIASHAGGVDEIIPDEQHGIVLGEVSAAELAEAISCLTDDPSRLEALKRQAHAYVNEHFTWESTAGELLRALRRAASC